MTTNERTIKEALKAISDENKIIKIAGDNVPDEFKIAYRDLFDLVTCYITVQDRNYQLLSFNSEFADAFAPSPGDYCYKAYKDSDTKCLACPVEKTFEDGKPHWSEESGLDKEGDTLYWLVKASPIKNSEGEVLAAMEMCLDITAMKKMEEALQLSESKYYAIFNNIPLPLFVLDAENLEILDSNNSVMSVYGYSKEEIEGQNFLDLFWPEERESYSSQMRVSSSIDQVKHLTKNGEFIIVNIRISPSEHLGKRVFLVTTSDITQRLEIEQQLIQAGKMATLGEMATGVAHELNQPLSVIKTSSNYFMRKIKRNESIEEKNLFTLSKKIESNIDRAVKIINHMRDFGRKPEAVFQNVRINFILKRAYEVLGQQLKLRGINTEWDLREDLPEVKADSNRLEQVFINLLINARDSIEEKIEKSDGTVSGGMIEISTDFDNDNVSVIISDNGCGIPEAILNRIFEPFFTTKKVGKGTGLGLSISYGIIQEYGGNIRASSNENGGSSFIITFPSGTIYNE